MWRYFFGLAVVLCLVGCHHESPDFLHQAKLYQSTPQQVAGNPEGTITVVEFFDYHCSACYTAFPALQQFIQTHSNVRVIYREIPILGADSVFLARAAVAAILQKRYQVFHDALMRVGPALDKHSALLIAAHVGLQVNRLEGDMNSEFVTRILTQNMEYARQLNINGTPTYLIAQTIIKEGQVQVGRVLIIPGALDLKTLNQAAAELAT